VLVAGADFSAKSYAADAAAQAAIATGYANLLNQVIHDFGDFQGRPRSWPIGAISTEGRQ
jgi:hypothetical protein